MGQSAGVVGCCAIREKAHGLDQFGSAGAELEKPMQFQLLEKTVQIERPIFASFAPVHQREASLTRRIALASAEELHVYIVAENDSLGNDAEPVLTHRLTLGIGQVITGTVFADTDNSRTIIVAYGDSRGEATTGAHFVRIWRCEQAASFPGQRLRSPSGKSPRRGGSNPDLEALSAVAMSTPRTARTPIDWTTSEGFAFTLDDHGSPVHHMAINKSYVLTADAAGIGRVWHKSRSYMKSADVMLHEGGISDVGMDRLYVYSSGLDDRRVCAWSLPELGLVIAIPVSVPADLSQNMLRGGPGWTFARTLFDGPPRSRPQPQSAALTSPRSPIPQPPLAASSPADRSEANFDILERVSLIRRPLSRWAGWQGSNRGPKLPRGWLFVAAVLRPDEAASRGGSGVLLEYSLGDKPVCRSCQVAHATAIVSLVYGPYDNGPLVSADATGVFRVWELVLGRGLRFAQQIETSNCWGSFGGCGPALAVEQPNALYVVTSGKRLNVWCRSD